MGPVTGRFYDGETARVHAVAVEVTGAEAEAGFVFVRDRASGAELARWARRELVFVPGDPAAVRLGAQSGNPAARLVVEDPDAVAALRARLPGLAAIRRRHRARQVRFVTAATTALAATIAAFVFGVPLIARQVVAIIPPSWETEMGERVYAQVEDLFSGGGPLVRCDPDPQSAGNRAIAAFVERALGAGGSPFDIRVAVVRSEIPNAFALPGGRAYYFSSLVEASPDPNAFAGVLAHEIGHIVNRHGMEHAVATAGTGLLVGMVLGDVTGLSVGAIVGQGLVNSHFSRDAERAADEFAIATAGRLGFDISALGEVLEEIAADTAMDRSISLLNSHPLTQERSELLAAAVSGGGDAFTPAEWQAIRRMCKGGKTKIK